MPEAAAILLALAATQVAPAQPPATQVAPAQSPATQVAPAQPPATQLAPAQPLTAEQRNEALIRQHHDAINRHDLDAAVAFYADKIRNNGKDIDRAHIRGIMADNQRAFPDWTMRIDRLVARGDEVVALMTVSGTHKGQSLRPVNGGMYANLPPNGRSFSVLHTHWFRISGDRIVEHLATRDDLGMSRQLGLVAPLTARPPQAAKK